MINVVPLDSESTVYTFIDYQDSKYYVHYLEIFKRIHRIAQTDLEYINNIYKNAYNNYYFNDMISDWKVAKTIVILYKSNINNCLKLSLFDIYNH